MILLYVLPANNAVNDAQDPPSERLLRVLLIVLLLYLIAPLDPPLDSLLQLLDLL